MARAEIRSPPAHAGLSRRAAARECQLARSEHRPDSNDPNFRSSQMRLLFVFENDPRFFFPRPSNGSGSPAALRVRSARGERRRTTSYAGYLSRTSNCPHPTPVRHGLHVETVRAAPSGAAGGYTAARMSPAPDNTLARAMARRITRKAARRRPTAGSETMRPGPTIETNDDVHVAQFVERALGEASTNLAADAAPLFERARCLDADADVIESP